MRCAPIAPSSMTALARLCDGELAGEAAALIELGINHEQQHQELLLTDILSLFAAEPLKPAYRQASPGIAIGETAPLDFVAFDGGIFEVGHDGAGFAYDNEGPRHEVLLRPFKLANRCVTNGEWIEFIEDGGYRDADALARRRLGHRQDAGLGGARSIGRPATAASMQMSLEGFRPVDPARPSRHVSYYEADAFARWAGCGCRPSSSGRSRRRACRVERSLLWAQDHLRAMPRQGAARAFSRCSATSGNGPASAYLPYPGLQGRARRRRRVQRQVHVQSVRAPRRLLRHAGGPHAATYRNFFYPHQRWQFMGLRLASEA